MRSGKSPKSFFNLLKTCSIKPKSHQDFTATVFFSSAAPRTVTLHYNMVSKVGRVTFAAADLMFRV